MVSHEGITGLSLRSRRCWRLLQPSDQGGDVVPGLSFLPGLLDLVAAITPHLLMSRRGTCMVVVAGLAALAAAHERLVLVVPPASPYSPAAAAALGSDAEDKCL